MYYNADDEPVGIEPVEDPDADDAAYTVSKTDSGGAIAPQAFLETCDLVPEVTTQCTPEWSDEHGMVVLDLSDPKDTYGSEDDE